MSWFDPNQIKSSIGSIAQNLGNMIDDPDIKQLSEELSVKQKQLEETQKELENYKTREEELNNLLAKLKTHASQKIKKLVQVNEELSKQINPDTNYGEIIHENSLLKEQNQELLDKLANAQAGDSEVEQLKIRVQKLEKENHELENESVKLQEQLSFTHNNQVADVDLRQKLESLDSTVESLKKENEKLTNQIAELNQSENNKDSIISALKAQLMEKVESELQSQTQIAHRDEIIKDLTDKLEDENVTNEKQVEWANENSLKNQILILEKQLQSNEPQNDSPELQVLKIQNAELLDRIKLLETEEKRSQGFEDPKSEIENLRANQLELNETIATLEAEVQELQKSRDAENDWNPGFEENNDLEEIRNALKSKINELNQLHETNNRATAEISQLREELQTTQGVLDTFEVETNNLQDDLERVNRELLDVKGKLKKAEAYQASAVNTEELAKAESDFKQLEIRYNDAIQSLQAAESKLHAFSELENLNQALQFEVQELKAEILTLQESLLHSHDELSLLKSTVESTKQEQGDISTLSAQLEEMRLTSQQLAQEKAQSDAAVANLEEKLNNTLLEMDHIKESSREEVLVITQMLDQVQQELDSARLAADKQIQQISASQSQETSDLNDKCTRLEAKVARLSEFEALVNDLKRQIVGLEGDITQYVKELTHLTEENAILDQARFELENRIHILGQNNGKCLIKLDKVHALADEIEMLKNNNVDLQSELTKARDWEQQVISLQSQVEEYKLQYTELASSLNVDNEMKEEYIKLREQLAGYEDQINQLNQIIADREAEIGNIDPQTVTILQTELNDYKTQCKQLSTSMAELNSLVENLSQENNALDQERNALSEKLSQVKLAVGQKIKAEMEESERLRNLLNHVSQEKDTLELQNRELAEALASRQATSDEVLEIERLNQYISTLTEKAQKDANEVARLREFLIEVEDNSTRETLQMQATIDEYRQQIDSLEREREQWESVVAQDQEIRESENELLIDTKRQLVEAFAQITNLQQKAEQDGKSIENLQLVLEQFEKSDVQLTLAKESEIEEAVQSLKNSVTVLEVSSKQFEERAIFAENELEHLQSSIKESQKLKQELEQKTQLVGQLRHDVVQLQSHLSEAMRRMKNGSDEDSVDRKLVSNLIIGFMTAPHGDRKRYEILSLMSSILKLNDEEKAKVGLIRPSGVPSPRQSQAGQAENFMDMWITFLVSETNKDTTPVTPTNNHNATLPSPQLPNAKEDAQNGNGEGKKGWLW
ncbi:hypothetical protein HDV06_001844 [Boothiomyces sp. JEL0866]|nr:hypothetical protein HDV06_001844 [Boothiomyces sp. JEL0866]